MFTKSSLSFKTKEIKQLGTKLTLQMREKDDITEQTKIAVCLLCCHAIYLENLDLELLTLKQT
jgi:hypothetical protein